MKFLGYCIAVGILIVAVSLTLKFLFSTEPKLRPSQSGVEAFNMGDFDLATSFLVPLAKKGDSTSQYLMGAMAAFGLGRAIDHADAKYWIARAGARKPRGETECYVGLDWATGQFGPVNLDEAQYWILYSDQLRGEAFCMNELTEKFPFDAMLE